MEKELKDFGLKIRESDSPNRFNIDFTIEDEEDNVAWVWGHTPTDIDWECNHPSQCIEYDDDETVGECLLCGSTCDWHKETDGENYTYRVPHQWYPRKNVGGIVGKILKEMEVK